MSTIAINVYAQDIRSTMNENGRYGYIDKKGNNVTEFIYDRTESFEDGVGRVRLDDKYGAVNETGKEIIPMKYAFLGEFRNGVAIFNEGGVREWGDKVIGGKWGLINKKNTIVVAASYNLLERIEDDLIIAQKEENWGVINASAKTVIPFDYSLIEAYSTDYLRVNMGGELSEMGSMYGGEWGVLDKTGKVIIEIIYEELGTINDGLIAAYNGEGWGFIDENGNEIVPFKYTSVDPFENGYAIVNYDWMNGIINNQGKEVVPTKYDNIQNISHGIASVLVNDKWGYIDMTGKVLITPKYKEASSFNFIKDEKSNKTSLVAVVKTTNLYGIIDSKGIELIKQKYDYISIQDSSDGKFEVELKEKRGLIDVLSGKEVIPPKYDYLRTSVHGLITVSIGGNDGLIDGTTGKEILTPGKYDGFSMGENPSTITVKSKDKWGVIDLTGKQLVPIKYDGPIYFSNGLARVETDKKYGFVDTTGKEVIPTQYYFALSFNYELTLVLNSEKRAGIIDKTGKEILPLIYDKAQALSDKIVVVLLNGKAGFFNSTGEEITPLIYDEDIDIKGNKAHITKDGKAFVIDIQTGEING